MADPIREVMFCHHCQHEWYRDEYGLICPNANCGSDFTEVMEDCDEPHQYGTRTTDPSDHGEQQEERADFGGLATGVMDLVGTLLQGVLQNNERDGNVSHDTTAENTRDAQNLSNPRVFQRQEGAEAQEQDRDQQRHQFSRRASDGNAVAQEDDREHNHHEGESEQYVDGGVHYTRISRPGFSATIRVSGSGLEQLPRPPRGLFPSSLAVSILSKLPHLVGTAQQWPLITPGRSTWQRSAEIQERIGGKPWRRSLCLLQSS